jgi:RND family efflux transporter MFP subunit
MVQVVDQRLVGSLRRVGCLIGIAATVWACWQGLLPAPAAGGTPEFSCLIKPYAVVALGAPVEGLIESVTVDRGDLVKQGQVLATLEASLEKATVEVAKAKADVEAATKSSQTRFEFSLRKLERAEDMHKSASIARQELDEARTEKNLAEISRIEAAEHRRIAQAEYEQAVTALALRTVRSPVTGVVLERFLSPGEQTRQTPILKVAQLDPLRVEVFASLSWLGKISRGMQARIQPSAPGAVPVTATVTAVTPVVDSASGQFRIRLEFPNPNHRVSAGLPCTVQFPSP